MAHAHDASQRGSDHMNTATGMADLGLPEARSWSATTYELRELASTANDFSIYS